MYLLDTNICIYAMKDQYPKLTRKLLRTDPSKLFISSVTVSELYYGAAKSKWGDKTRTLMHMFLASFTVLPFTGSDAIIAGDIRALLESEGTPIGPYDTMIAAQGLSNTLTVITHNTKEFKRVPGLSLKDWTV